MRIMFFSKMKDDFFGISITNAITPESIGGTVKTIVTKEDDLIAILEDNSVIISEEQCNKLKSQTQGFLVIKD